MILSRAAIKQRIAAGDIFIEDFDESRLNPNSYNLRLWREIALYRKHRILGDPPGPGQWPEILDLRSKNPTSRCLIPEDGMVLKPGILYLASTLEMTETRNLVPQLQGRSSTGRVGLFIHVTAGFGDIGFRGRWTLELAVVEPLRIYAGDSICQIIYHVPDLGGEPAPVYAGRYQDAQGVEASKFWMGNDFRREGEGQ